MTDSNDARDAQADARKAQADQRQDESLARDAEHTKADRNVTRTLVYGVIVMFAALAIVGWFAWQSYRSGEQAQERSTRCLALVLDHEADAWVGVGRAFTTPAVTQDPTFSRLTAVNSIVTAANRMKVQSAKCAGSNPPSSLPPTVPIPPTTVP